jgi:aspartyl aminopeptidase
MTEAHPIVSDFLNFLNQSCTAFHAVETSKQLLLKAGFIQLEETEPWSIASGNSYFFIRSGATIIAFTGNFINI